MGGRDRRPRAAARSSTSGRWLVLPGMVDLHAHLPQLPNAGLGFGLDLLTWLERYIFPLERGFDEAAAERLAPAAFRAFAAAGTTTALLYGAVYEPSLDAAFRAAEAHGIRAIIGKVMMDRLTLRRPTVVRRRILDRSACASRPTCARAGTVRDDGRLRYAFTPRFAVSCSAGHAARVGGAGPRRPARTGRPTSSEDRDEIAEVARLFPDARRLPRRLRPGRRPRAADDPRARHPPLRARGRPAGRDRDAASPTARPRTCSWRRATMPLARYLERRASASGSGSDVAGRPGASIFAVMRVGAYVQNGAAGRSSRRRAGRSSQPLDWLRLGTLDGARALGPGGRDRLARGRQGGRPHRRRPASRGAASPGEPAADDPAEIIESRLIFRPHPGHGPRRPGSAAGGWTDRRAR